MPEWLSGIAVPLLLCVTAVVLLARRRGKRDPFDAFLSGAKDGMRTAVGLLPTLVPLLSAVSMLRASGFCDRLAEWLAPFCTRLGIPAALLPLVLLRPVSGSGSNAMLLDLFEQFGADSFVGLCASVLLGSSDTLVYIIAVYFSAAQVRRTRHALPAAVLAAGFALLLSCFLCRLLFGEAGLC